MNITMQVAAGEGQRMWDLTAPTRQHGTAWLAEIWRSATIREAAATCGAPQIPPAAEPTTGDPLSQLCLQMASHLLANVAAHQRPATGLILATQFGCLRTDMEFDASRRDAHGRFASPAAFRGTLPSHIPAAISVQLALRGPVLALAAATSPLPIALQRATAWLHHQHLPHCLTGTFDWPPNANPRALLLLLTNLA